MLDALERAASMGLHLDLLGEILLAAVLGGVIGIERELSNKAAGFRTNILISAGAALWMQVSELVAGAEHDPSRIPAEIVSGIGFIGGGAILVARGQVVVGLTTAATIWVVAAIGVAVGAHAYAMALGTTFLVLATLLVLGKVEARYLDPGTIVVSIALADAVGAAEGLEKRLAGWDLTVRQTRFENRPGLLEIALEIGGDPETRDRAIRELIADPSIVKLVRVAASGRDQG